MSRICLTTDKFRPNLLTGGLCMKGGIYSEQKCTICGSTLKDDGRKKICCPLHTDQVATNMRVHFGKVKRRFKSYLHNYMMKACDEWGHQSIKNIGSG